ncbi:MAG: 4-alpha-glucanotransferase, partial [Clostridia bacterium]|nr:4-alpha-glucanotransferase [Clostridia bacterium]
ILLPISELPSKYGIGSFGKWAYKFVDFLKNANQKYWQVLPLVQTGYGDSPYQTVCDISGNPYFIDLEILRDNKLLTYREVESAIDKGDMIDYGKLYFERYPLLRKAYARVDKSDRAFRAFVKEGKYTDYALFMTLAKTFEKPWFEWPEEYKRRHPDALNRFYEDNKEEVLFWQFLQFEFFNQYFALKKYANQKGISIIGDLPLYVAHDSVEVWTAPEDFMLDDGYRPSLVAGVPPDYFSADGQLWGNPCYNYDHQRYTGFAFWKKRMAHVKELYDIVRIDHFRGLDRFWTVNGWESTARNGWWSNAPGREVFAATGVKDGIIAEDLGVVDGGVISLINDLGFPGMKVLSFAFNGNEYNPYLPWNVNENSVTYTGTHDNDTLVGYYKSLGKEQLLHEKALIKKSLDYLKIYKSVTGVYALCDAVIDIAYACASSLTVIPMHDLLLLGTEYRINTPGTTGWWRARIKESVLTDTLATTIRRKTRRYGR